MFRIAVCLRALVTSDHTHSYYHDIGAKQQRQLQQQQKWVNNMNIFE